MHNAHISAVCGVALVTHSKGALCRQSGCEIEPSPKVGWQHEPLKQHNAVGADRLRSPQGGGVEAAHAHGALLGVSLKHLGNNRGPTGVWVRSFSRPQRVGFS